jgi:pyruvate kinase
MIKEERYMQKFTKIVATIGPATETEEIIKELIEAGMNVARFNTKHGTPEWHQERIQRVRKVAAKLKIPVGILLDLQGPEIRMNLPDEGSFEVKESEEVIFSFNKKRTEDRLVLIPENVVDTLQRGSLILLDDGVCEFEITGKGKDYFKAKALGDFEVKHRKTLNTPGITIDMPSLIKSDLVQLDGLKNSEIDFVGLSFVRDKQDIKILQRELDKRKIKADIIAKIENQSALDNLDEIIESSEAVMVARGDLAVEVPFEQLSYWQKMIIAKCRYLGKPVITATQMLKSMVENPRPTRAEVSDVANSVYDSTSAVMLSEETTIGSYPVKTVETQAKIVAFNEQHTESYIEDWVEKSNSACITHAAIYLLQHRQRDFDSIVCVTETGDTAKLLARFRPNVFIKAITNNLDTYHKLSLVYGVKPYLVDWTGSKIDNQQELVSLIRQNKIAVKDEQILLVYGAGKIFKPGFTNSISLVAV